MGFKDLLDRYDSGEEIEELAPIVTRALVEEDPDYAIEILLPLVKDEIRRYRRAVVLKEEKEAFQSHDPLVTRKKLLQDYGFVPGIGRIPWGEITLAQHIIAADHWRKIAGGFVIKAERHDRAIDELRAAHADCLNDIAEPDIAKHKKAKKKAA